MSESVAAKGAAGTVHLYPEGEKSPKCGTYAPLGPASSHGAKRRHAVDVDDVDPWTLCEKCFPDKHKDYPENDHWFDVRPAREWDGTLGSDYTCFVECTHCGWKHPARSKSEAYAAGYDHKRYPDDAQTESDENDLLAAIAGAAEGDEMKVNDFPWGEVTETSDEHGGALADGHRLHIALDGRTLMVRSFPDKDKAVYWDQEHDADGEVDSVAVRGGDA